ncbi:MAG: tetratricopeptide repeat protein [Bacteroidetes bacterium]|nr:MAG: tetratricopeptide repeat protein [Bacteroidota bacterium]
MNSRRLELLLNFLQKAPEDAFTLYSIAYEYALAGEHEQAVAYFRRLQQLHPTYTGTYYHLGKSLEQLQQRQQAIAVYHQGLEVCRQQGDQHNLRELQAALNNALEANEED